MANITKEEVERLILTKSYRPAKTMPTIPHEYTLYKDWGEDQPMYSEVVKFITENGYQQEFYGRKYTYYDIGIHQYWAIGVVLNRAIRK